MDIGKSNIKARILVYTKNYINELDKYKSIDLRVAEAVRLVSGFLDYFSKCDLVVVGRYELNRIYDDRNNICLCGYEIEYARKLEELNDLSLTVTFMAEYFLYKTGYFVDDFSVIYSIGSKRVSGMLKATGLYTLSKNDVIVDSISDDLDISKIDIINKPSLSSAKKAKLFKYYIIDNNETDFRVEMYVENEKYRIYLIYGIGDNLDTYTHNLSIDRDISMVWINTKTGNILTRDAITQAYRELRPIIKLMQAENTEKLFLGYDSVHM